MWEKTWESYEAFPSFSRIKPFASCSEGGWYPKATSSERRSRRIPDLMRLTLFHTEYGMPSGPEAEEGEDVLRACQLSSLLSGSAERYRDRRPLGGMGCFCGKKWCRRALLMETGSEASGREGNLQIFRGATNCLAVQMF